MMSSVDKINEVFKQVTVVLENSREAEKELFKMIKILDKMIIGLSERVDKLEVKIGN